MNGKDPQHHHYLFLPTRAFLLWFARNLLIGATIVGSSLFLGMYGYHHYENMTWIDAYVNASMILSGMGPVSTLATDGGKIFAGTYALFSGILFLVIIAVVFGPVLHRLFHKFHIDGTE